MKPLKLTVRTVGDIAVVKLEGDLHYQDTAGVMSFVDNSVFDQGLQKVVFDMADVTTVGSEWLGAFTSIHIRLTRSGQQLHLINPREPLVTLLSRTRLDSVFLVHHDVTTDAQIEELFR